MEFFLIILLVLVLFFEHGENVRKQITSAIIKNHRGVVKYFGSAAILSLTLSIIPNLLLSIYMRHFGFFAYEVFGEQQHAINVLSLNVFINFLVLSIYLFFSALLWAAKANKTAITVSLLIPLTILLMFGDLWSVERSYLLLSILVFVAFLGLYLVFWIRSGYSEKARYWWTPLVFSMLLVLTPIFCSEGAVILTENALFQMRVGGIDVELSETLAFTEGVPKSVLNAKLILRTPEFYYLKPKNQENSILIISTEHVSLRYNDGVNK